MPRKRSTVHTVYLPEIDAEHRDLIRMTCELRMAIQSGGRLPIQVLARNLFHCFEEHFLHEQRRMRETQYPAYEWHKKQHDTVRKRGKELIKRIEGGDAEAPGELQQFLAGWLRDHAGVADSMMGAYLRNYDRLRSSKPS